MITRRQRRRRQALSAYVLIEMEKALAAATPVAPPAEDSPTSIARPDEPEQADAGAPFAQAV